MDVLHVEGKELKRIKPKSGNTYEFLDGDVYVVDNGMEIYIWRGKDCGVDEQAVGAWVANKLDNSDRSGEPTVTSMLQGEETPKFKSILSYNVVDGDTPGFLKHAELDLVEYKLYRVYTKKETRGFDEAFVEEVKISKKSLKSDDVYVLDGNENIYMWIGTSANREEQFEGFKLMKKIDASRHFLPLTYNIHEGEGGKTEKAFFDFLEVAAKTKGKVVSVEDQRELSYRPEGETGKNSSSRKKKGLFARLFSC
ncbi:MAG: hypothetical protein OEZ01_01540 [Candidatus Heimdallarchaeota archaeon]|nr:hypothetical protein [Candidatus Heimdallarchaeota archaeon]MDH5644657.1 hypothetical protein [Candidatus Heimdallarchaeota archaeon]